MNLPTITSYGDYSSSNYGLNSLVVTIGNLDLWFSYKTIMAFRTFEDGFHIRENDWSTTTGKHLNWINRDKSIREDSETFEKNLQQVLKKHNLV